MAARRLLESGVRIRRGRRRDLPAVERVLGRAPATGFGRVYRRVLRDLGTDVYVAEDAGGAIVGLVAVVYARSLVRGGASALLDGARAAARPVLDGLVAFAEERARRRGCRRLEAFVGDDAELRAALVGRGWRTGELLATDLAETA
ncbi:MAG TPA: hypothetical protein VFD84_12830 [Candidatus Binatia bacterium]|nr:hypothetical protein [Candidatus Binatia bacterium]